MWLDKYCTRKKNKKKELNEKINKEKKKFKKRKLEKQTLKRNGIKRTEKMSKHCKLTLLLLLSSKSMMMNIQSKIKKWT